MNETRSIGLFLVVMLALQFACTTPIPATVTNRAGFPLDRRAPIFVIAQQQRDEIVDSLDHAGVLLTTDFADMRYVLEVKLGDIRGRTDCGTIHNVSYVLTGFGQRLMVIKGRGLTGFCDPNIFDDMGRELAANLN